MRKELKALADELSQKNRTIPNEVIDFMLLENITELNDRVQTLIEVISLSKSPSQYDELKTYLEQLRNIEPNEIKN